MADDFDVLGQIVVDDSGAGGLRLTSDLLDKLATQAGDLSGVFSKLGGLVEGAFVGAAVAGVGIVANAMGKWVGASISAAAQQQDIMAQMTNVLDNARKASINSTIAADQMASAQTTVANVTIGSQKEIAKVTKAYDSAQQSLTRLSIAYNEHSKHSSVQNYNLSLAQQKVADLKGKYDALTATVKVHTSAIDNNTAGISRNAAALHFTTDDLEAFATQMAETTRFTKAQYEQSETLTLQFDKISKETFPQVIKAAADLATRTGVDLVSATNMLTRALGDPIMGIGRLNQQFKLFEPTQLKAIENMARHGQVAQAQQQILDKLSQKMGGAATDAAHTLAGKVAILSNKVEIFNEKAGDKMLPILDHLVDVETTLADRSLKIADAHTPIEAIAAALGLPMPTTNLDNAAKDVETMPGRFTVALDGTRVAVAQGGKSAEPTFLGLGLAWLANLNVGVNRGLGEAKSNIAVDLAVLKLHILDRLNPLKQELQTLGQVLDFKLAMGIGELIGLPATSIQGLVDSAVLKMATTATGWIAQGENIVNNIVAGINQIAGNIETYVMIAASSALTKLASFIATFVVQGNDIINNIVSGIKQFLDNPGATLAQLAQKIPDAIATGAKAFIQAGEDIINGILAGINNRFHDVVQRFIDLANAIPGALKQALGIGSPSKVMMEISHNIARGLELGLSNSAYLPRNAMNDLAGQVIGAVNNNSSEQNTTNYYYFGATLYQPRQDQTQGLTQAFRKS